MAGAEPGGQRRDEKMHAAAAPSAFGSENVTNIRASDHFLTVRWPFDVEKVHAVVARSTRASQKCKTTGGLEPILMS